MLHSCGNNTKKIESKHKLVGNTILLRLLEHMGRGGDRRRREKEERATIHLLFFTAYNNPNNKKASHFSQLYQMYKN